MEGMRGVKGRGVWRDEGYGGDGNSFYLMRFDAI